MSYEPQHSEHLSREEAIKLFESLGAKIGSSVTRNTTALIVGRDRGHRKYADALQKGVPILPWEMVRLSGIVSERPPYTGDIDSSLLSETAVQLLVQIDQVYAHIILSTGRRRAKLWRAFAAGLGALNYFLQGTWGSAAEGGDIGLQGIEPGSTEYKRVALGRALAGWIVMIKELEDEERAHEKPKRD